ncbi:hypothetical protein [Chitinophaga sancti]|nr:hypothetical protein [Chitinophaga sancti]WQD61085.1 hypothetical protein U0033_24610 [Chitinophaga sancti]WQG86786.1 hypothetical protein SR876_17855 [Chitinophaga sancti]
MPFSSNYVVVKYLLIGTFVAVGFIAKTIKKSTTEDYPYKNDPPKPAEPEIEPDTRINVITDAGRLEKSRAEAKAKSESEVLTISSLAKCFRRKDPSVIFRIVRILNGQDAAQCNALLGALTKNNSDELTYAITDSQMIQAILAAVSQPELEEKAVELAGTVKLSGFPEVFEKRLMSGNSTVPDRLIYWLSHSEKGASMLPYLETNLNFYSLGDCLRVIAENGNQLVQDRVGELALKADKNLPGVLECCFLYGDERVIPIAREHLKHRSFSGLALSMLIRFDGPKYFNELYELLKSLSTFDDALYVVEKMDKGNITDSLLRTIITQLEATRDFADARCYQLAKILIDNGKAEWLNTPGQLSENRQMAAAIDKAYKFAKIQLHTIVTDLRKASLVPPHYSDSQLETLWKISGHPGTFLINFLDEHDRILRYDAETGEAPVPYAELMQEYKAKSLGTLNHLNVWADANGEKFTILSKDSAYVVTPGSSGDWYDVPLVNELIAKILTDLNCTERFLPVNTGDQAVMYVFGYPAKVHPLIKKYLSF